METQTETNDLTPPAPAPVAALSGKRANWVIAHKVEGTVIKWMVKDAGTLTLDVAALHEKIRERAAVHGMIQRVSDAAAIPRDTKTGASATAEEKFKSMQRLVEHYASGSEDWNRKGGERAERVVKEPSGAELLRMALAIAKPQLEAEKIAIFVKARKANEIAALLGHESMAEAVALAKEELEKKDKAAAEGVNAEELLSGL